MKVYLASDHPVQLLPQAGGILSRALEGQLYGASEDLS
jgi:hypothetical protein